MERGEGMKVFLVNGSPRKAMNTTTVLEKIAEGARTAKAEAEVVHLIDYSYMGCINCFRCVAACPVQGSKRSIRPFLWEPLRAGKVRTG